MNNLHYLLALNRMDKIGPRTVFKLLTRWPNLQHLFQLSAMELEQAGLPKAIAHTITAFDLNQVQADLEWSEASEENHLLSWENPDYPEILKEISDPPIILYAQGDLSALKQTKLAVVGSRNPSITGSENAKHFAKEIASQG
ncbi:MAG: DNA-processing protein DprA, partial [Legionellales bacterium]